jgi:hypothetical protein
MWRVRALRVYELLGNAVGGGKASTRLQSSLDSIEALMMSPAEIRIAA